MADDNIKSTVIRKARVSFVKDNIQNIIHYETDADCVKNLNTAIVNGVSNVFNNDETIRNIITNIALNGENLKDYAKLDSPSFTGEPKVPTASSTDNSTKIANTEFVNTKINELKNITASKTDLNNYVTKAGNDTITGQKTFSSDINVSDGNTIYWKNGSTTSAYINKSNYSGTSDKAVKDQNGNIIDSTYATKTELAGKQNLLVFDTTPKVGSTNPVTSEGVYNAIKNSGAVTADDLATVAKTGSYTDLINTPSLATDSTLGFTKLFSSTGSRADGTITQAGITELLSYKMDREDLADIALSGEWADLYNVPIANDTTEGVTKLYTTLGQNTDGAISQYGMNNILANYAKLTDVMAAYRYKGTVDNYSDLPTEHKTGDVYNIVNADATHNIKAGDNVAWNGSSWDNLSGIVDLSNYYTKPETDKLYLPIKGNAVSSTTSSYVKIEKYRENVDRFIPIADSRDGSSTMTPTSTRVVYDNDFTYNPSTNVLKVGNIYSANIIKSITMSGNIMTITKGDGSSTQTTIFTPTYTTIAQIDSLFDNIPDDTSGNTISDEEINNLF